MDSVAVPGKTQNMTGVIVTELNGGA